MNEITFPRQTFRVGTDVVSIARIAQSISRDSFIKKVFHPNEITYCQSKPLVDAQAASFAARFAAKEAFLKALGTGLFTQGMGPQDVWIEHSPHGRPVLNLSTEAQSLLAKLGHWQADVSLAHDGDIAIATVIVSFSETN